MSADLIHRGHINIIKEANNYGDVVVGLLTDEAIESYKRVPLISFKHRKLILENMKDIKKVIAQETLDYVPNLKKIRPDFVVHGDDWKNGVQKTIRANVIKVLKKWNGSLIEPKYTSGVSTTNLIEAIRLRKIEDKETCPLCGSK